MATAIPYALQFRRNAGDELDTLGLILDGLALSADAWLLAA